MPRIKTFYDELGVERSANAAEIKHAFKEAAKTYHPDKNPTDKQAWAHEQMSRLNFIVETLLNPTTRKEYADNFPMSYAFSYFFALIGGVMIIIGMSDYLGRGQYRRRIRELEERRSHLRQRMYEALVSF